MWGEGLGRRRKLAITLLAALAHTVPGEYIKTAMQMTLSGTKLNTLLF